ncbi:hypothetical protein [Burkholderia sp. L27(2015)]|uniref:hypothetical protein n=1 Tax=Burkholderia sp. L27(2015) TaxID=1641858 RepID=UPI0020B17770|nr:hypothetical protein [Burkholderia sp. L27(2015)]
MTFEPEQKRREAAEAGKKFVAMAYADVWAKDVELVKRVRGFLGKNFHWHDRLVKSGADLDVVQTLNEMVRGDSVVVIPEDAMWGGSLPSSGLLPATKRAYSVMDPETAAEMRAIARSILYPPGEAVLSGPYRPDREACGQLAAARAAMAKAAGASTPLGDAQAFEYIEAVASGNADELAASTNNPRYAAKMLGYDQDTFSEMLHRFKPDKLLRPSDNVIWHDNGDVYFNGKYLDNFHDWAN